jgi:AraC-like DNA-binding protein
MVKPVAKSNLLSTDDLLPASVLQAHQVLSIDAPELLHLSAGTQPACWRLAACNGTQTLAMSLLPGQGMLLACQQAALRISEGVVCLRRPRAIDFAKLLAFVDEVEPRQGNARDGASSVLALEMAPECASDRRALEYWFIRQLIAGDPGFAEFKGFLRRLETYWLVKYLVSESAQQKSVGDLGDAYGLSYSHFRRVCKAALGNSVKSELQLWRAARSLLDVIAGRETMTEVAIRHGYASSSHFSTEIKKLFGMSPRAIMELNLQ